MPTPDYTWPKPWLLECYQRAVDEGCIRIKLRGPDFESEWKSFKAAFYRLRRRKDGNFLVLMRAEYQLVNLRYEPERGTVLIVHSALPDGEALPAFESVDDKVQLQQPLGSRPPATTPEAAPDDFDPTQHVAGLIDSLHITEDEDDDGAELS
jgi:hypothetical protein